MKKFAVRINQLPACTLMLALLFAQSAAAAGHRISGTILEERDGVPDVTVILCDQKSGLPVSSDTFLPFTNRFSFPPKLATTQSQNRGAFAFDNVPDGEYRLVAQKWVGPFKGLFEVHGSVIQLFGSTNSVRVPSSASTTLVLRPPGDGVLAIDLDMPNTGTLMVLSTQPMLADPILGFHAPGTNFITHSIGLNVMPYGRTTIVGVPRGQVHAWYFVNDNSPGFASAVYDMNSRFFSAPRIRFVAGWSDGQHEPPPRLKALADRLKTNHIAAGALLGLDQALPTTRQIAALRNSDDQLAQTVQLPDGERVKKADLIALVLYENLQANRRKR